MNTPKYILYADDDEDDLNFFSEVIAEFPEFTLLTFASGTDLLDYIDSSEYRGDIHLIISDINMPVINGLQTVRRLKAHAYSQDIPVCLYSTSVNPMDKSVAAAMNTRIFLKANTFNNLKDIIEMMLKECSEPVKRSSNSSL